MKTILVLAIAGALAACGTPPEPLGKRITAACEKAYPGDEAGVSSCQLELMFEEMDKRKSSQQASARRAL